jgi:hypothetical protein
MSFSETILYEKDMIDVEMFKNVQNICKSLDMATAVTVPVIVVINLILILCFKRLFYQM